MITKEAANDGLKEELIDSIQRAWTPQTGGLYTRALSDGQRYHIMAESCLMNEKKVSADRAAIAAEQAVLAKLRDLPDDAKRAALLLAAPSFGVSQEGLDSIQFVAAALADVLEQKP